MYLNTHTLTEAFLNKCSLSKFAIWVNLPMEDIRCKTFLEEVN